MRGWTLPLPGSSLQAGLGSSPWAPWAVVRAGTRQWKKQQMQLCWPLSRVQTVLLCQALSCCSPPLGQALGRRNLPPQVSLVKLPWGSQGQKQGHRVSAAIRDVVAVTGARPCPASAPLQLCAILSSSWKQKLSSGPSLLPARPTVLST